MSMALDKKYTGNGGIEQRIFIMDARIGWKALLSDPHRHLAHGVTRYNYLEDLGMKLSGQARRVVDNFLDKWDHTNEDYEDAITREASRHVWRAFYKRKDISDLRHIHVAPIGRAPTRPVHLEILSRS